MSSDEERVEAALATEAEHRRIQEMLNRALLNPPSEPPHEGSPGAQ